MELDSDSAGLSDLSDSGSSVEYLVMTRERRSNAGNKMKKLLEQELEDARNRTQSMNNDDIDLLFEEDEEDEDFEMPSLAHKNKKNDANKGKKKHLRTGSGAETSSAAEDADEDENELQNEDQIGTEISSTISNEGDNDDDLMLSSDSDINEDDEDDDNEAGEKELQKQERLRKRRKRAQPTVIRKRAKPIEDKSETSKVERKSSHDQINAESLLFKERRTSKRASAVANKLKVYEKLSRAEERRKEIQEKLQKHKQEQAKLHTLTQEDRLKIAEETEKLNLLSLNKFKEQELSKKQSRMALLQRQKLKFKASELVMQFLTTTWQFSPLTELEDQKYWNEQLQKRERKKRKKYVRRSKKNEQTPDTQNDVSAEVNPTARTTEEISSIPSDKSSNINSTLTLEENNNQKENNDDKQADMKENGRNNEESTLKKSFSSSQHQIEENSSVTTENGMIIGENTTITTENGTIASENTPDLNNTIDSLAKSEKSIINSTPDGEYLSDTKKQVSFVTEPQVAIIHSEDPPSNVENSKEPTPDMGIANANNQIIKTEFEDSIEGMGSEVILQYEGPFQQVSKNFVTAYSFAPQLPNGSYYEKTNYNFIPQKSVHVDEPMEPLLRSKLRNADDDIELTHKDLTKQESKLIPNLKFLDGFPSFGEYEKKVTDQVDVMDIKVESIKIATKAPTGIYYNNIKKHCMINNKDCQYFDPKLGIPYSDLTSYKIIQDIQCNDSSYKWFGFENGGLYLNINEKPAKGVPEGF